jgi:hypothetical protein
MNEEGEGTKREAEKSIEQRKREILGRLRFDETEFLKGLETTVGRAQKFIRIEPHSGRVVLTDPAKSLTVPLQIRLLLTGRYFSRELGDLSSDKMGYKELAAELNRPASGVSTELTDLVREGDLARDQDGLVSMPFHRVETTLIEAERASSGPETGGPAGEVSPATPVTRSQARRRTAARKADPDLAEMLASGKDTSAYAWVKELGSALDKGLAGLAVARDVYGKPKMTCAQLEGLLTSAFGVPVTRAAINMAFIRVKGNYIVATQNGQEIEYGLLVPGEKYLDSVRSKPKPGTLDAISESENPSPTS